MREAAMIAFGDCIEDSIVEEYTSTCLSMYISKALQWEERM